MNARPRGAPMWAVGLAAAVVLAAPSARADGDRAAQAKIDAARTAVEAARREGGYSFCTSPPRDLSVKQEELCPLASEIEGCEGFAKACERKAPKDVSPAGAWGALAQVLGPVAQVLIWVLVIGIALALIVPIAAALVRARRDRKVADPRLAAGARAIPITPAPPDPTDITDAELALREADALARRGELVRALGLYLAASLAALDHRGAIRLARHRTNGEYVRFCTESAAKEPLRELVREVDRVDYGKLAATPEAVTRSASRAAAIVRAATTTALLALVLGVAGHAQAAPLLGASGRDDPAGDGLPVDVLARSGWTVSRLATSIATMPMPEDGQALAVIIDVERVALEDESRAHLLRWVEAGGIAILLGPPKSWPESLEAKASHAKTRDLVVGERHLERRETRGARVATAQALDWPAAKAVAHLGDRTYAATRHLGRGVVLGVANDDLFTNVGVARPANAAALVALVEAATAHAGPDLTLAVARAEDGIPPPSSPFAALARAGLAKGAWHALAAALVLFLAYGVRRARARPASPPARRAFAEHVEATGAFYGRARAYGLALSAYGRFADLRLRERLPRGVEPVAFLAARAGAPLDDVKKTYERALSAKPGDAPRGDELATLRELRALLAKALGRG